MHNEQYSPSQRFPDSHSRNTHSPHRRFHLIFTPRILVCMFFYHTTSSFPCRIVLHVVSTIRYCIRIPLGLIPSSECIYRCHHFHCDEMKLQESRKLCQPDPYYILISEMSNDPPAGMTAKVSLFSVVSELCAVSLPPPGFSRLGRIKRPRHDVAEYLVRQVVFKTPYRDRIRNCSACRVSESLHQVKVCRFTHHSRSFVVILQ